MKKMLQVGCLSNYPKCINGSIISWTVHQISMFSNKVNLLAGYNNDLPHPLPSYWINELTNQ